MAGLTSTEIDRLTNEAIAAYRSADHVRAQRVCHEIIQANAQHPYALNLLGVMLMEAGDLPLAHEHLRQCVSYHAHWAQAWNNLGVCEQRMGRRLEALAAYERALAINPSDADARGNFNQLFDARVDAESDETYCLRRVARARDDAGFRQPQYWLQLAILYYQTGRLAKAIDTYLDAQAVGVIDDAMYGNLGAHYQDIGRWGDAETAYRAALALNPKQGSTLYNLGSLLSLQHQHEEAESCLRRAMEVAPQDSNTYVSLGHLLMQSGTMEEAMRCFDTAQALAPSSAVPASAKLFNLAYLPGTTALDMLAQATLTAHLLATLEVTPKAPLPQRSVIRVGFVSGDLKDHPVGYFLENLLRHVNRTDFEWHIFSNFEAQDAIAMQLRTQASSWTSIANQSDATAKAAIENAGIDILFDLSGHTALNRLPLFAQRAAPIQIGWLGWHDTTGIPAMDYLLTDHASLPSIRQANGKPAMSEQPLYLAHTRLCMMPPAEAPPVAEAPALRHGYVTFGSMQILAKITDPVLAQWSRILSQAPTARLHIRTKQFRETSLIERFKSRLVLFGLPLDRVALLPPLGRSEYLAAFSSIDILLDTAPYPGGTTTAEALWMGVPTITQAGHTMVSMQGVSLLTAAGMQRWIAASQDDYVSMAVAWTHKLPQLQTLRQTLRQQVAATALFDGALFARDFEDCLQQAYAAAPRATSI